MREADAGIRTRSSRRLASASAAEPEDTPWMFSTSAIWSPTFCSEVEAGHRLLEDHAHLEAAHGPHLGVAERQQLAPVELDRTFDPARVGIEQPHYRQRRHRLARAGLADDRQRFARRDVEGQALDDLDPAVRGVERGLEVTHRQDGVARLHRLDGLGLEAPRASPSGWSLGRARRARRRRPG